MIYLIELTTKKSIYNKIIHNHFFIAEEIVLSSFNHYLKIIKNIEKLIESKKN
jgi:hypothetical protein